MSVFFSCGEQQIWNPASLTGAVFIHQIRFLEETLGVSSGFGPVVADEVVVDSSRLSEFASKCSALAERLQGAPAARALLDGVFSVVFCLAQKVGVGSVGSVRANVLREQASVWM